MVDVYTKLKPDSFKSQLQAVLTAFYENIKGVQGASGCPKTKILKRRFEDHEDAGTTPEGRGWHRGRERCRRRPGLRRGSGCSPGRSLQLRLRLLNLPPARRKGGGTGW